MKATYKTKYLKFIEKTTQVDLDTGEIYHYMVSFHMKPELDTPCYCRILVEETITDIVYDR